MEFFKISTLYEEFFKLRTFAQFDQKQMNETIKEGSDSQNDNREEKVGTGLRDELGNEEKRWRARDIREER